MRPLVKLHTGADARKARTRSFTLWLHFLSTTATITQKGGQKMKPAKFLLLGLLLLVIAIVAIVTKDYNGLWHIIVMLYVTLIAYLVEKDRESR